MIGKQIHEFAKDLWPINRSITGDGVRETLKLIQHHLPSLKINAIPSETKLFDWTVPKEWSVKEAYIITPSGKKICEFAKNNLHLLGYSTSFKGSLPLDQLKRHLYTLKDQPNAIPFITSYYKERWGFCLTHKDYEALEEGDYQVVIDTMHFHGELNYGELFIKGKSKKEIFLSTYICHPSMANNELSGPTVTTFLAKWLLSEKGLQNSYRIIFIPETIGAIAYLSKNHIDMKEKIFAGFNVTCVGDDRAYSFLPSRAGDTISDKIALHVLKWTDPEFIKYTWLDRGSDERQYCAPGIDLPVASIMRTKYGEYPEYHTSLDNLDNVVTPIGLNGGYWVIRRVMEALERNKFFMTSVLCEPQMGKRGLYPTLSANNYGGQVKLMMDFISLCDGHNSLLDIADILDEPIWELYELSDKLERSGLISEKKAVT